MYTFNGPTLPPWQRRLRHLRSITLHRVSFDTGTRSSGLLVELWPLLPPPAAVAVASASTPEQRAAGVLVDARSAGLDTSKAVPAWLANLDLPAPTAAALRAVAEGAVRTSLSPCDAPASSGAPLLRTAVAPCSLAPQWDVDPAAMATGAGWAGAVRLVLRRVAAGGAVAADAPLLWERTVHFDALAHLDADPSALLPLLPPGVLLLRFVDGPCLPLEDVLSLEAAGIVGRKEQPKEEEKEDEPAVAGQPVSPSPRTAWYESLSTKEIKEALQRAGVSTSTCFERADFEALARQYPLVGVSGSVSAIPASMITGLDADEPPALPVVAPQPTSVAQQEAWVAKVEALAVQHAQVTAQNEALRARADALLERRAERQRRSQTRRAQQATLAALREEKRSAQAALAKERHLIAQVHTLISETNGRIDAAARALVALKKRCEVACGATKGGAVLLDERKRREQVRRKQLLLDLCEAIPLELLGGGSGGKPLVPQSDATGSISPTPASTMGHPTMGSPMGPAHSAVTAAQNASADEEDVAAVLGDAAMLVVHVARLLSVTLRYPVRLGASRCSIDDPPSAAAAGHGGRNGNGATATATALKAQQIATYPLYPKGADPMKLQHAVLLLGRNVQQLLLALGELPPQPPRNILPALHLLVQRIAAEWPLPLPPSANSNGITGTTTMLASPPYPQPQQPPPGPPPGPPPPEPPDSSAMDERTMERTLLMMD